ncbi:MAG: TIGR02710 family CRISPR-associated CARF protein [Candidatus Bipolaricaulota bacterium]|nr:TIGR02710 family CRISPR-associated CARF protein [Candidatus Bipolaricaulota bacterium]
MPRGMVVTVGLGREVEHGIAFALAQGRPEFVVFVVTPKSRAKLEAIHNVLAKKGEALPDHAVVELADENDVEQAYRATRQALAQLRQRGLPAEAIALDYTSGSKPMAAGALYAALLEGCGTISYITGERDLSGRVISNIERLWLAKPVHLLAELLLQRGIQLFNLRQFRAVQNLLGPFLKEFPAEHAQGLFPTLVCLNALAQAYEAWDAFDHAKARDGFCHVNRKTVQVWPEKVRENLLRNKGWVCRLSERLTSAEDKEKLCPELLVDLWANALRRLQEGRFLDAVARLYRLAELIAQFRLLHRYGINTNRVELAQLPASNRAYYERFLNDRGELKLGAHNAYKLLADLGDTLGHEYFKGHLDHALSARNNSVIGHGLNTATEEVAHQLCAAVEPFLRSVVPDLEEKVAMASFPVLEAPKT